MRENLTFSLFNSLLVQIFSLILVLCEKSAIFAGLLFVGR